MIQEPLILSLYGGPGTGKSTTAALLFGRAKQEGINAELVPEYAKDMTWEQRMFALSHQPYLMAKQLRNYDRLYGKVDLIVTDTSPLLANIYMDRGMRASWQFLAWVEADWNSRRTLNVFLERDPDRPYNTAGRSQDEQQAKAIDMQIRRTLERVGRLDYSIPVDKDAPYEYINNIYGAMVSCLRR